MKRRLMAAVVLVATLAIAGPAALAGGPSFGFKSLSGGYAFSMAGSDTSQLCGSAPCPVAITGQVSSNGKGGITGGSIAINDGGIACSTDITNGSYSIQSDGAGSIGFFLDSAGATCSGGKQLPVNGLSLSLTMFKNGSQGYLATDASTSLVLAGTLSSQKKFP